jgi:hypothetical protein
MLRPAGFATGAIDLVSEMSAFACLKTGYLKSGKFILRFTA